MVGSEDAMTDVAERLIDEAERATGMLAGKTVKCVRRWREQEVLIEFSDGARLFIDIAASAPALAHRDGTTNTEPVTLGSLLARIAHPKASHSGDLRDLSAYPG